MIYLYSSCFASFLLDEDFRIIEKREFKDIMRSNESLEQGAWLGEEIALIKKYGKEVIIFIGFKWNEKIKNVETSQDMLIFSQISESLKKEISNYYSSNRKITQKEVNSLIREDKDVKENFEERCRNLNCVAGKELGLKLIKNACSLKKLASMPSSKIQLLGAERSLFRHLKKAAPSPKHGIILSHPLVSGAKNKGKAARLLADKIAIAARIDYFKGKFIGDKLRKDVEEKIK